MSLLNKIPGEPVRSKSECQGYIKDLSQMQLFELEELLDRQNKILSNRYIISKLADKGEKIDEFRKKIEKEIDDKKRIKEAIKLLSKLNIATEGKAAMTELEWTGKYEENNEYQKVTELDSEDELDPLQILAQPTGTGTHKKKVIYLSSEKNLIKKELDQIEDSSESCNKETDDDDVNERHAKFMINKVDKSSEKDKTSFKPYKTTKSNVHDPEKEKFRKKGKYWEVTAATPPFFIHGPVKTLSLDESLKLEKEKAENLKKLQVQQAAERLVQRIEMFEAEQLPIDLNHYHDNASATPSDSENEENQVYDDEDDDKGGTVVFTVDSVES